jgi:hypothetical protein
MEVVMKTGRLQFLVPDDPDDSCPRRGRSIHGGSGNLVRSDLRDGDRLRGGGELARVSDWFRRRLQRPRCSVTEALSAHDRQSSRRLATPDTRG